MCCGIAMAQTDVAVTDTTETDTFVVVDTTDHRHPTDSVLPTERVFDLIDTLFVRLPLMTEQITDSLDIPITKFQRMSLWKRQRLLVKFFGNKIDKLNEVDTTYITPQLYDYAFMLQNTNTFESFTIRSTGDKKQSLRFAPNPTFRLGGYFGWRWLFLGYTFDINRLFGSQRGNTHKTEVDLSLYTSRIGIDFYYRQTGNDFHCVNLNSLFTAAHPRPAGISNDFSGLDLQTRGFNVYYIFNHRRFSYPAAFSQSTVQRRSAGTIKLGFSFTHHRIAFDYNKLDSRIHAVIDPTMLFSKVKYNDYNINVGYAYNWVFRRNWLACASLSPGLSYNVTYYKTGDTEYAEGSLNFPKLHNFSLDKLNLDFITRIAVVYNNTHYFAGLSFILHSFDYKNRSIQFNNSFGSVNVYAGFNFKRKRQ